MLAVVVCGTQSCCWADALLPLVNHESGCSAPVLWEPVGIKTVQAAGMIKLFNDLHPQRGNVCAEEVCSRLIRWKTTNLICFHYR